jgi:hypothetical protein
MERFAVRIAVIVLLGLTLASWQAKEISAQPASSGPVLARVGPITVTAEQLKKYAMHRSDLTALVGTEAGGKKILEAWLEEKLLALYSLKKEGKDPFETLPKVKISELAAKIQKLLKQEFPPLSPATDEEALDYYKKNPDRYAIPVRLHVKKMWFVLEGAAPEGEQEAWAALKEAKKALDSGAAFESTYEAAHSKVSALLSWDFGFVPMDGSFEGQDLVARISSGQSRTWKNKEGLFLFYVVHKKPGRVELFENVKDLAKKDLEQDRERTRKAAFFERLKKEFGAQVLL